MSVAQVPDVVTVHCFFGCDHVEFTEPGERSRAMEVHYADAHSARLDVYPPVLRQETRS